MLTASLIAPAIATVAMILSCSADWTVPESAGGSAGMRPDGGVGGSAGTGGAGGISAAGSGTGGLSSGSGGFCAPGGTDELHDDFNDGTTDPKWSPYATDGGTYIETDGHLVLSLPIHMDGLPAAGYRSTGSYRLADCHMYVEAAQVNDPSTTAYAYMYALAGNLDEIAILESAGTLYFGKSVKTVVTFVGEKAYEPDVDVWWRMREDAGTLYWETSPNGQDWAKGASEPTPIDLTSIQVGLESVSYDPEIVSPGAAKFDNFNVAP